MIGAAIETQTAHLEGETGTLIRPREVLPRPRTLWLEEGGTSGQSRQLEPRPRG